MPAIDKRNRTLLRQRIRELPGSTSEGWSGVECIKVFTPDGAATWFLYEYDNKDRTCFGLCDLGLGFPELGYVSVVELLNIAGKFGLGVELDEHWSGNLADGYVALNLPIPEWLGPIEKEEADG